METVSYWVDSYRVPCTGVAPMQCLQVRKEGSEQWQNFYSQIAGFEYEPGFLYRIRVQEEKLDPKEVPADASSVKYTLVSIEEKVRDPRLRINDIWVLEELEGRKIPDEELSGGLERPSMEFHLAESRFMGTDGCNSLRGSIEAIGERELRLGPAMSTKMSCGDMTLPDAFLKLLSRSDTYRIEDGRLWLSEGNTDLLTFRKTD